MIFSACQIDLTSPGASYPSAQVHERTFQSDMLALFLKVMSEKAEGEKAVSELPKLVVMSATLQGNTFGAANKKSHDTVVLHSAFLGA